MECLGGRNVILTQIIVGANSPLNRKIFSPCSPWLVKFFTIIESVKNNVLMSSPTWIKDIVIHLDMQIGKMKHNLHDQFSSGIAFFLSKNLQTPFCWITKWRQRSTISATQILAVCGWAEERGGRAAAWQLRSGGIVLFLIVWSNFSQRVDYK